MEPAMAKTRAELLVDLEAAALAYGAAYAKYLALFRKNGDGSRPTSEPLSPETAAACDELAPRSFNLNDAAKALHAFDSGLPPPFQVAEGAEVFF